MTDLHWALLGLGILIIAAVLVFNWWQERKFKQETSKRFEAPQYDALMEEMEGGRNEEFHINPDVILKDDEGEVTSAAELTGQQVEQYDADASALESSEPSSVQQLDDNAASSLAEELPMASEPAPWEDEEQAASAVPEPEIVRQAVSAADISLPAMVNPAIDLAAVLVLPKAVAGNRLREFLLSITDIDKPVHAYGLADDRQWHLLTREQEFSMFTAVTCALQLVDRAGAVSRGTLSRFHLAIEDLAQTLGATVEWRSEDAPLQQAAALDQFCIEVDQMVAFHLVAGEAGLFAGTKFRGLMETAGLVLGDEGTYYSMLESADGSRQVLFSIVNHDKQPFSLEMLRTSTIRGVTFQLDIPRVPVRAAAYDQMVKLARNLEQSLGAHLVDDKQRELSDVQIDNIRQQIKVIHSKMQDRHIAPGEAYALRLFS
ncbi:ZipA, C-terminal FtsZ-binding domain [Methylobacillus rhizosphaerae]|uniref:Cell division protein ZipA n=1 Tax=Methylobacillus rhizosphaerae TaxID=551994 RepID=A0A238YMI4_9PROT|nr:cell division protein ZipA C-terminal FtsZ-binding domain-containing protein [Methylobacillus rhizosphaerae]SNR72240.1 ZipA, C-terminal FtsZ-binding domain [Methylobacillus rhizosphaerae]